MQNERDVMENKPTPTVVYEDEVVVVINKPAGLIVHSDGRTEEYSVAQWVVEHYPAMQGVGEAWTSPQGNIIDRPGIVHRLDRTTSGILILAKTQDAHAFLKEQFKQRTTEKIYDAVVYGHTKEEGGVIEAEIGRSGQHPKIWSAQFGKKGNLRAAITHWKVLARGVEKSSQEKIMHLEVSPKTGRTHQIRVHLKAIHHPIVCDHIYAVGKPCLGGIGRPALHARSLTINLPQGGAQTFVSPLPDDMRQLLANIDNT